MRVTSGAILSVALASTACQAFTTVHTSTATTTNSRNSNTELYGMNRKARRNEMKKQNKGLNIKKTLEETKEDGTTAIKEKVPDNTAPLFEEDASQQSLLDNRPDVSMIVEDDNGMKRIVEGRAVLDITTGKAVKLSSLGPDYRLAEMFPGVPPDVRQKLRKDKATVDPLEILEGFKEAVTLPDGSLPKKQVSDKGLDYMTANWDLLGEGMKKMIGRLKLRNQWQENIEEATYYRDLWFHYMVLTNKCSAPFRQICFDAEMKIGPNFGNMDVKSYCGGDLYERAGAFIVLKSLCSLWEKKTVDAQSIQNTPSTRTNFVTLLCMGDPKRFLPGNNAITGLEDCAKIAFQAQQLFDAFINEPTLFDDLPPELRFIAAAGKISSGTELRRYMIEDFCPQEGIEPEALREGVRRLVVSLQQMQIENYGDFAILADKLADAMAKGSPDERDPYFDWNYNLSPDAPGFFQTYTFNHDVNSMVRFLDNVKTIEEGSMGPTDELLNQFNINFNTFFGDDNDKEEQTRKRIERMTSSDDGDIEPYDVPEKRALGRPHDLGWLSLLDEEPDTSADASKFEADEWEEIS